MIRIAHRRRLRRHRLDAARGRASVARPSSGRPTSLIHIEAAVFDRLRAMRRDGESNSDVILRLVELEAGRQRHPPRLMRIKTFTDERRTRYRRAGGTARRAGGRALAAMVADSVPRRRLLRAVRPGDGVGAIAAFIPLRAKPIVAASISGLRGERWVTRSCPAIAGEAEAREAEQHHRPCRGLGDGWRVRGGDGGGGEGGSRVGREQERILPAVVVAIPDDVARIVQPVGKCIGPRRPQHGAEVRRLP